MVNENDSIYIEETIPTYGKTRTEKQLENDEKLRTNPNLLPFSNRTEEEKKQIYKKISDTRKKNKSFQQLCNLMLQRKTSFENAENCLSGDIDQLIEEDGSLDLSNQAVMIARMTQEAQNGSVKAFEVLRDSSGNKPKETVDISVMTDGDRALMERLNARLLTEKAIDHKI